jgi:hypothetical protein
MKIRVETTEPKEHWLEADAFEVSDGWLALYKERGAALFPSSGVAKVWIDRDTPWPWWWRSDNEGEK